MLTIKDLSENKLASYKNISYDSVVSGGDITAKSRPVLAEHTMDIIVSGDGDIPTVEGGLSGITCTPLNLPELTAGRLLTVGVIATSSDIKSISISEDGLWADVELSDVLAAKTSPDSPSAPFTWDDDMIFALSRRFEEGLPLHEKTGAAHCCILMHNGYIIFECDDIGRHNALDKAIGYALINDIGLRSCIAFTSGRIPLDMAGKAITAGIPVLASKASVTDEAVIAAKKHGLTLLAKVRPSSYERYA